MKKPEEKMIKEQAELFFSVSENAKFYPREYEGAIKKDLTDNEKENARKYVMMHLFNQMRFLQ